ncbi:MAG: BglII/BstYI family type II restriction endonuclease [Methanomassiliicoccales archaeon]
MRIVYEYSHLGGSEILKVRYPAIEKDIYEAISEVKPVRSKISEEKTMRGKALFDPTDMNRQFRRALRPRGYKELRDTYDITIPGYSKVVSGAYKQIDFTKDMVLVEVQFGKYAFMFYDMAKFQYFFNEKKADVGVEIVPCHDLHSEMSTGVSYGEQLIYDIERLKRHFPAVPVKVILVDDDHTNDQPSDQKRIDGPVSIG